MFRHLLILGMMATCVGASAATAWGQTNYAWATGDGTWDTTTANWTTGSGNVLWPNSSGAGKVAVFATGTNTLVSLSGNINVGTIQVNPSIGPANPSNITIDGSNLRFGGVATASVASGSSLTINSRLVLNNANPGIQKTGGGLLTLSNTANAYTGPTRIHEGTLQLGNAGVIPNESGITFGGAGTGTLATNGYSEMVGVLALDQNGTIALGSGSHTLEFAGLSANGGVLTITGWDGEPYVAGQQGRIIFSLSGTAASNNTLYSGFLSQVNFGIGSGATFIDYSSGKFELVAAPEPTTVLALGALGLAVVRRLRRRKGAAEAAPESNVALAI